MTLHEAMVIVLREHRGWMDRDELARAIAARDLYRQRAGGPPPSDQLRLRGRKYPHLFEGSDSAFTRIRLRAPDPRTSSSVLAPSRPPKSPSSQPSRATMIRSSVEEGAAARLRRWRAARKYKPDRVKLLLVAEAPPAALDRYFYFEDVPIQDSLFRYVTRAILGIEPTRQDKPRLLARLREVGVFLIDLREDPIDGTPLSEAVPSLIRRAKELDPEKIILIKATVYDAAFTHLREAGLPVVTERVPFPGSGQQKRFMAAFKHAMSATH